MAHLVYSVTIVPGTVTLRLSGELDMAITDDLVNVADKLDVSPGDRVQVDLAAVTFVDSMALGALLTVSEQLKDRGVRFAVVAMSHQVRGRVRLTGLAELLCIEA
jgi:anti-anti-sigma factor